MSILERIKGLLSLLPKRLGAIFDLNDLFILVGISLVSIGIWQIYSPAAWIAVGICFLWLGIMGIISARGKR